MLKIFHKGFNEGQDGPGNRLVIHMQGCNFRCPWCANPESMDVNSPCKSYSENELIDFIMNCRPLFYGGGGVTFTGGEPTLQFDELKSLLKNLKDLKINTAIETNGSNERLPELFELLDYLMIDLKHCNLERHKAVISHDNQMTKKNIVLASKSNVDTLVRIPLINGFNTDIDSRLAFVDFLEPLNVKVELLKYHEYGKVKWENLGLTYTVNDAYVKKQDYDAVVKLFSQKNIQLINT